MVDFPPVSSVGVGVRKLNEMQPAYAELHCKSNFSFLEGASHPAELVERAAELHYGAIAISDRNSLAGMVRAHAAAKDLGMHLLVGSELHFEDAPSCVVWAPDRAAYGQLCRLLTIGRRRAIKGECQLFWADLESHQEGLLAGFLPPSEDAALDAADPQVLRTMSRFRELFTDRGYLLAELHRGPDDAGRAEWLAALGKRSRLPVVAAGGVEYHCASRKLLHDLLAAIRNGDVIDDAAERLQANAQRRLHAVEDIRSKFAAISGAVERTMEVAQRCRFSMDELRYEYPEELAPGRLSPFEYLCELTWRGARKRYPTGVPATVRDIIAHELDLIGEMQYEAYFLTVWDLVRFARSRGILCQGRGSAANSAVCFCLGVTSVDPARADLLFERFVSKERNEAPDIDVDFEHERREEVLQYLYEKYGRDRAGLTAVVVTYRSRSAIRDVGKALGLSLDRVDALAKQLDGYGNEAKWAQRCTEIGLDPESQTGRRLLYLVEQILGFPRHLSQHVGGMVMTRGPLCELSPIENAAMANRTVIQWDKDDLDELGVLKVDCLSLGMLTAIHKSFDLLQKHYDRHVTLATTPAEDPGVYDMICRADTIGVFQIESRAQMSMLPRLKPRCYYDLVIEVAIVRPGPIQGQMVHPYLRRRAGEEQVSYPTPEIQGVLEKTLGVPLFQEQAMRLAVVAAGFSPGEADQLRRAMGAWRRPGVIDKFRRKLIQGMRERGLSEEFAEQVFRQIRGFGEYGFPESHAASFALLVYVSAWLKCYYPAAFTTSLINSQPMGFYSPSQLLRDAREHGVEVLPVDVNSSSWDCTLESMQDDFCENRTFAIRLGFRVLRGVREELCRTLVSERKKNGPFKTLKSFATRTHIGPAAIDTLAAADAFRSLGRDRRNALWESLGQERKQVATPLLDQLDDDEPQAELPVLNLQEQVYADYQSSGLSLRAHPIGFHREALSELGARTAKQLEECRNNSFVRVAGIVLLRQRPSTAKGITFVTLEDETGVANLVVRQPVWDRYYRVARSSPAWLAHGKLERKESVIHVVVQRLEDLSEQMEQLQVRSRDFR